MDKKTNNHYKYVHIFVHDDIKFNPRVLKMINNVENDFDPNQHLFVTMHERVYNSMSSYNNIVLIDNIHQINKIASYCDWIFFHSVFAPHKMMLLKNKYTKKIIWRTWGHDARYIYKTNSALKNLIKRILNGFWTRRVKQFRAIGVANLIDIIDISTRYGDSKSEFYPLPYANEAITDHFVNQLQMRSNGNSETLNIMVGHSGHLEDNHIKILNILKKHAEKNIHIYIPLSYGNAEYIEMIKEFVKRECLKNITIIDEFLDYDKYAVLLSNMNVIILDSKRSYALGNLAILISLNKKIFLAREGVLHKVLTKEQVPHGCIDELEQMEFAELAQQVIIPDAAKRALGMHTYKEQVEEWKNLLNNLGESDGK